MTEQVVIIGTERLDLSKFETEDLKAFLDDLIHAQVGTLNLVIVQPLSPEEKCQLNCLYMEQQNVIKLIASHLRERLLYCERVAKE